jgi:hypothetical protein
MLAGHYSAALLGKALAPRLPLWMLALAVQLVDVLWACFVLTGIEHLRIDPSLASNPLDLYHMPYTHSLVGVLFWAGLAGAACFLWRGERLASLVLAGAVASHWPLDWLVHRPDLLLWSGSAKHGLALWNFPALALGLEASLLAGSAWILMRSPEGARLRPALVRIVSALLALQILLALGPQPRLGASAVVVGLLALFAAVAWSGWRAEPRLDARATGR